MAGRNPRLDDVAAMAGVSAATVSRFARASEPSFAATLVSNTSSTATVGSTTDTDSTGGTTGGAVDEEVPVVEGPLLPGDGVAGAGHRVVDALVAAGAVARQRDRARGEAVEVEVRGERREDRAEERGQPGLEHLHVAAGLGVAGTVLAAGARADLVVLDSDLVVTGVLRAGEWAVGPRG